MQDGFPNLSLKIFRSQRPNKISNSSQYFLDSKSIYTSKPIDVFPSKYWYNVEVCFTLSEEWTSFPHNIQSPTFLGTFWLGSYSKAEALEVFLKDGSDRVQPPWLNNLNGFMMNLGEGMIPSKKGSSFYCSTSTLGRQDALQPPMPLRPYPKPRPFSVFSISTIIKHQ